MKNLLVYSIVLIQWCTFVYCCFQTVPSPDVTTTLPTLPTEGTTEAEETTEPTTEAPTTQAPTTQTPTTQTPTTQPPTTQTTEAPVTPAACQKCQPTDLMILDDDDMGFGETIPFQSSMYDGMAEPCATFSFVCASEAGTSPYIELRNVAQERYNVGDDMGPQTQSDVVLTCGQDEMWGYQIEMGPFVVVSEIRCFALPPP